MLKIVLCDDEPHTLQYYAQYIAALMKKQNQECSIDTFSNSGLLFSQLCQGNRWNICFLDIDMPLIDGLSLGHKIKQMDASCYLVYVSVQKEKVYDSLSNRPFRFIPKDEFTLRIEPCIRDILSEYHQPVESDYLVLESGNELFRFRYSEIAYIKSLDKYISVVTADGSASPSIRYKLGDLEALLVDHGFIRVHRSFLVNYLSIKRIHSNEIVLDNNTRLPISRYRLEDIKTTFRRLTL